MSWAIHQGDALDLLRGMPDERFNCCVTSPPYWGLRDYGTATWEGGEASCEHKGRQKPRQDTHAARDENHGRFAATRGTQAAKAIHTIPVRDVCRCGARRVDQQIGLEASPDLYVERMVEVFRAVRRVLRKDGTLWLNLGDCYMSNIGAVQRGAAPSRRSTLRGNGHNGGGPKLHAGVPFVAQRVGLGLKEKDLVGMPWRVALALQADGWWLRRDIIWHKPNPMPESVSDRPTTAHEYLFLLSKSERYHYDAAAIRERVTGNAHARGNGVNPKARVPTGYRAKQNESFSAAVAGLVDERNKRSVWTIPTSPFHEAHFATFPPALVEPCIRAGCPAEGVVLDPFAGAGTTLLVATRLGRSSVGLELNPEYAAMARRRITQDAPLFNTQEVTA